MSDDGSLSLLQEAVAALSQYFVGDQTLSDTLHRVAELSMSALPQVSHVGITLMVDGRPGTAVFTHPEVPEIDQAQYRTGRGPCLDAFRDGLPYIIESTLEAGTWQEFRDSAAHHGVYSSMSLPLIAHSGPIGALNMYAESEGAFGAADCEVGSAFAAQAAFVLANAQAYWDARTLSENLAQAMVSRATIEQAKGIIIATSGCTEDEAMQLLVQQSQHQNVKVRDIAREIVENTTRRSR
jgi:GAF domain-containing protein